MDGLASTSHAQDHSSPESNTSQRDQTLGVLGNLSNYHSNRQRKEPDLIQLANKSCTRCRERRVRCNREWPTCDRCLKRKEECDWGPGIQVETRERDAVPEATKIQQLEAQLAAMQEQLDQYNLEPSASRSPSDPLRHDKSPSAAGGLASAPRSIRSTPPTPPDVASLIQQAMLADATLDQSQAISAFVLDHSQRNTNLGPGSVSSRLGASTLAQALALHLIDASTLSSCSRLPAFRLVKDRVDLIRQSNPSLINLSPAEEVDVVLVCALGARASPHSGLLGVPTLGLADGTAKAELYLTAGARRQKACRQLESKARLLAWEIVQTPSVVNLETLVGMAQLTLMDEAGSKPVRSRFYLRSALGIYQDLQHDELKAEETKQMQQDLGKALWIEDAMVAAQLAKPCLVTASELADYFSSTGIVLPNFAEGGLPQAIENLLDPRQGRPTKKTFSDALELSGCWVCACQREFAMVCTVRRPSAPSIYDRFRQLWSTIDTVHSAVQRLQQALVSATSLPGAEDDPEALDHFVLFGVRIDSWLVDLIWLIDSWLKGIDRENDNEEDVRLLNGLKFESELRLRKCLRLSAFYAQLYLSSNDKHVIYHAMLQLELVPDWPQLVVQKYTDSQARSHSGSGPSSQEFELTDQELDWLESGLTLASFYHPQPAIRLQELVNARARARPSPFSPSPAQLSQHASQSYYHVPAQSMPDPGRGPPPDSSTYPTQGGVNFNPPQGSYITSSGPTSPYPPAGQQTEFPQFNFDELGVVTSRFGQDEFGMSHGRGLLDLPLVNSGFGGAVVDGQGDTSQSGGGWMDWALDDAIANGVFDGSTQPGATGAPPSLNVDRRSALGPTFSQEFGNLGQQQPE